jgi:hypothetical protein
MAPRLAAAGGRRWLLLTAALGFAALGLIGGGLRTRTFASPRNEERGGAAAATTRARTCRRRRNSGPVVPYEQEFPYDTTCPRYCWEDEYLGNGVHGKNATIAVAYHVGMLNNWRNVVIDQLQTLHRCGLGHAARHLLLSHSGGGSARAVTDLMKPYGFSFELVRTVQGQRLPYEAPMMNALHEYCTGRPEAVVFYFHSKGVTRYNPNWRNTTDQERSYSRVLYWRKSMEYFILERPQLCLDAILNRNKSACGTHYRRRPRPHFSGNFWAASCEYLAALPPLNLSDADPKYIAAELWIGKGYDENRFVGLWGERPAGGQMDLYKHWIQPSEYRFPEDRANMLNITW